jgi:poly [ADP-ribose] polymerase
MLDTLSDMEVASSIMKTTTGKARDADSVNLLDKRFADLGMAEMTPLDLDSTEYRELAKYLVESSGQTHHRLYRLQDIFRIERQGENKRFETSRFAKLKDKDRRLLWHGSRTTNFGGILSQGLRIAPPEAPVNGYAFGKGVYLADVSSKSANYCNSGMSGNVGCLLLCEVELSRPMYEIPTGNSNAQQEAEKQNCISTKGVGRIVPQAWKDAGCLHENLKGVAMVSVSEELGKERCDGGC